MTVSCGRAYGNSHIIASTNARANDGDEFVVHKGGRGRGRPAYSTFDYWEELLLSTPLAPLWRLV